MSRNIVGPRVRTARSAHTPPITQRELAERLQLKGWDVSRAGIAKIEAGLLQVTDVEVTHLAEALGVTVGGCSTRATEAHIMRIGAVYSHLNGQEWLLVHYPELWREVEEVVRVVDAEVCRTKVSRERGMEGRMLYSPTALNAEFKAQFQAWGWQERRTTYWVTDDADLIRETLNLPAEEQKARIEAAGKEPLRSYNQTDLQKGRVSVELQFGKYSFVAHDLSVKHLGFYVSDVIDVGIEMLPTKNLQRQMSSGVPYYEGALYDVVRQGRASPPVPLVLVGLEC